MDLHPTPFPGKRRAAVNRTTKKERDQPKPAASQTQSKPKRTFGRNLSGNITFERPSQKSLTAKPWKPSGVSKNNQKPPKKVTSALACSGSAKSGSNKKDHHVTFLETPAPTVAAVDESIEVSHDDVLICTPVLSTVTSMPETPYQSAENCSKCRLDRLETASYWLSQVKLAEPTGKHFVSAAFFRLALECRAQPFVILQNELKHYRDRHGGVIMESLWDDLCQNYGLISEQSDANFGDVDSIDAVIVEQFCSKCTIKDEGDGTDDRDMCIDYDIIDKPEHILKDFEPKNNEPKKKQSEDGMLKLSSSLDSPFKKFHDVGSPSFNFVLRGGVKRSVKIVQKKSKFGDLIFNDSTADTRTNKSIISSKRLEQAGTKNSASMPAWKKKDRTIIGSSDLLKSKGTAEEQYTSNHFDENVNLVEDGYNVEGEENEIFNQKIC
ncbi:hypothetical protein M5K25_002496 [Dendrobium thyrsiflorum]|uniref:Uncharacterized protein n=1 Tax=Dendrobium thyrsiflorum TaxID=117978 RepID=A0ABD0VMV2_DENTH